MTFPLLLRASAPCFLSFNTMQSTRVCVSSSRKRSASASFPEATSAGPFSASRGLLKRTKTDNELDTLGVIPEDIAWHFDVSDLLKLSTCATPSGNLLDGGPYKALSILCVVEDYRIHLSLLCRILPDLRALSPHMQVFQLRCGEAPQADEVTCSAPPCERHQVSPIPTIRPAHKFIQKLGLLHPLGGGLRALDSIVVVDNKGKRRLVLPFGWGPGRHVAEPVGGRSIAMKLIELLKKTVRDLEKGTI